MENERDANAGSHPGFNRDNLACRTGKYALT
jgi:hypothetical protein